MIPKIIFQAWIGEVDPPEKILIYMDTVKKAHPDWCHVLLKNKDIQNLYSDLPENAKRIYDYHLKRKEWGLVLDPIRFLVPYKFGGIFMDTDIKVYPNGRSFNELPLEKNLILANSFETSFRPHTFFLASSKGNRFMKHLLDHMGLQSYEIPRRDVYNSSYMMTEYVLRFNPEIRERIVCGFWKLSLDEVYVPKDEAIINNLTLTDGGPKYGICKHWPMSSHTKNKHKYIKTSSTED
jgi:hypothetical protein